jgi:hypothetical protein
MGILCSGVIRWLYIIDSASYSGHLPHWPSYTVDSLTEVKCPEQWIKYPEKATDMQMCYSTNLYIYKYIVFILDFQLSFDQET